MTSKDYPSGVPIVPMRLQPLPEFQPYEQPVIAYEKVRYVGEPIAVVLASSVAIGEDALEQIAVEIEELPAVATWQMAVEKSKRAVRRHRHQPLAHVRSAQGRCRRGVQRCALYAPRTHAHRPPLRPHHGATRGDGGVGRGQEQAHRFGRREGAVLQPPHPGEADRVAGIRHRDDRERCRRRLWRAGRVLSGRFSHPVCREARQPAGEVDRGSPRKSHGDEPRPRDRGRS